MSTPTRQKALLCLLMAAAGLALLALGLPGLAFQPGLPIPGAQTTPLPGFATGGQPPAPVEPVPWLFQGILALGFILLVGVFIYILMKKSSPKRVGLLALGLLALFVLFNLLPRVIPVTPTTYPGDTPGEAQILPEYNIAPIGDPPAGLLALVLGLLAAAALALLAWLLARAFRRAPNTDRLAGEVDAALQSITSGGDLKSAIIRCYLNMEALVRAERGIERGADLTPREFETFLVRRGIPSGPLLQLTRLFEQARYGSRPPGPSEEQAALDCLTAIQTACRAAPGSAR